VEDSRRASGEAATRTMRVLKIVSGVVAALLTVLVLAVLALVFLVDLSGLIDRYTEPALDAASAALGREVEVEDVHVTWFPILGVEATGVELAESKRLQGAEPFVRAEALAVGIEVWPALVSMGKNLRVDRVVLSSPVVRVVQLEDGSFNFSDIGAGGAPDSSMKTEEDQIADYVQSAHARRIAIEGGELVYVAPEQDELRVQQLDFEAREVELGQPVSLELALALFAQEQNLRLKVQTGPLAEKLSAFAVPVVKSAELVATDFPLAQIAKLAEVSGADLSEALLTADVVVKPSATGIRAEGPIDLRNLRLGEGTSLGAPFDAGLTLALATGYDFAELRFDPTEVRFGPARLRAQGLVRTATLSWSQVQVDTRAPFAPGALLDLLPGGGPDPEGTMQFNLTSSGSMKSLAAQGKLVADGLDYDAGGARLKGPASITYSVSGAPSDLDFEVTLAADGATIQGEGLGKKAGTKLRVEAQGQAGADAIKVKSLAVQAGGSRVTGSVFYPLGAGKLTASFDTGRLDLEKLSSELGLDLGIMAKGASLSAKGTYAAPSADPATGQLEVPSFTFEAGDNRLQGSTRIGRFDPLEGELSVSSPALNADQLLGLTGDGTEDSPSTSDEPLLPPSMKEVRFSVKGDFKRLIYSGVAMQNADLLAVLEDGKLKIRRFDFEAYGGSLDADGTVVDLTAVPLKYELKARLRSMNAGQLLSKWTRLGSTLSGELNTQMSLSGSGLEWEQMAKSLAGGISAEFANGSFTGVNVFQETLMPLSKAVSFVSPRSVDLGNKLSTDFRRLAGEFQLEQGQLKLARKLKLETKAGLIEFGGGIGLDQKLNLKGDLMLTPDMIRQLTRGKVKVDQAIPMGFGVGCSLTKPCIENVDVKGVAGRLTAALAKGAAEKATTKAKEEIEKRLPDETKEAVDKAKDKAKEALKGLFGR
jgi:uncharacterized protein involved in outer membrane biogenesis